MSKFPTANKDLGQHFLHSKTIIEKITTDFKDEADAIIEIGPGPGVLSEDLAKLNLPYFVVEKDVRFTEQLSPLLSEDNIFFDDALKIELEEIIKSKGWESKKIWLVSNLPYNVSVPLTMKFLRIPSIKYMSLMYQKEVAERIVFPINKKNPMGSLAALCQNYFDVKLLTKVPPGAFSPPPKVDSAVISFSRREETSVSLSEFKAYESFLRSLFQFKRKKVFKNLNQYPKDVLEAAFTKLSISTDLRAETFNLEQIQLLYKELT